MKIKSQRDFWAGMMFLVVGIAFAWGSTGYSFGTSANPGPGYFPFGLGVLLALLGAAGLFKALTIETEGGNRIGAIGWRPLVVIVGSIALFGYTIPRLGLFLALPLLVVCVSLASEDFRWRDALINGAVLTAGSWLLFVRGLKLSIPLLPS